MLMPPIHNVKLIIKTSDSVTVQVDNSETDARVEVDVAGAE
jgi:hypothetical protein